MRIIEAFCPRLFSPLAEVLPSSRHGCRAGARRSQGRRSQDRWCRDVQRSGALLKYRLTNKG